MPQRIDEEVLGPVDCLLRLKDVGRDVLALPGLAILDQRICHAADRHTAHSMASCFGAVDISRRKRVDVTA